MVERFPHTLAEPSESALEARVGHIADTVVPGLCACGCGQPTAIRKESRGIFTAGEPYLYVSGHTARTGKGQFPIEERDEGYRTPCTVWLGAVNTAGYGTRGLPGVKPPKLVQTHREAYEAEHGAIPDGWVVHHLCGVKRCLKVDHLEAMPRSEHLRLHLNPCVPVQDAALEAARSSSDHIDVADEQAGTRALPLCQHGYFADCCPTCKDRRMT